MAPLLSKSALLFLLLSPLTQGACISRGSHSSFRVQDSNGFDVADATANESHRSFIENLPAVLEKARIEGGITGMAVAVMHKGHIVFAQGFGKRNRKDPFTTEVSKNKLVRDSIASVLLFFFSR